MLFEDTDIVLSCIRPSTVSTVTFLVSDVNGHTVFIVECDQCETIFTESSVQ